MEQNEIKADPSDVLSLASEAGHILLENGAEISRVEETMERICTHFGTRSSNFFVISNGIFSTSHSYANVEFIPIKGARLDKVAAVNQLSRDLAQKNYSVEQAREELEKIRRMPAKPAWERLLGAFFGCGGFCAIFGGGLQDCIASAAAGALVEAFIVIFADRYLSKILSNIICGMLGTAFCILFQNLGFGESLGNMIIGTLILMIPGVAFANGLRDIANEDYLAGITRLVDATMVFLCIALGACMTFIIHGWIAGTMINLTGAAVDSGTFPFPVQLLAAFVGTYAFAIIFSVPRSQYLPSGLVGMLGWTVYLIITRYTALTAVGASFFASIVVAVLAHYSARIFKSPGTIYLICGLFPLIPGAGVFWSTYFTVSEQFHPALGAGFLAVKIAIAIVLGVVIATNIPYKLFVKNRT